MKKYALILAVAVISVAGMQCSEQVNPVDISQPTGYYYIHDFFSNSIDGDIMQDFPRRNVVVYTPPGYDPADTSTDYPVLYLLHGYGGNEEYFKGLFGVAETMDELIYAGEIDPMIVVTADASNKLGGSFYTNSPDFGSGSFAGLMQEFITDELLALIDSVYNTIPDRQHRGIAGHSMGGYGAVKLAMLRSDVFGSAASMSGPLTFWGTYPQDTLFAGLIELLPYVFAENGAAPGDTAAFYSIRPGTGKSLTNMMFAMASAFSPHDPADTDTSYAHYFAVTGYTGYVDLPFDVNGDLAMPVWNLWMANDVLALFAGGYGGVFDSTALYIDCGDEDDLGLYAHAQIFYSVAGSMVDQFEIYSGFEGRYSADHTTYVGERLRYVAKFHDGVFSQ